jgi:hypothetical protein
MKSGFTFALLLGVLVSITALVLKTKQWPDANGLLMVGVFLAVIASVFLMLKNAPRQSE